MANNTSYRYTGLFFVKKILLGTALFLMTIFLGRLERYGLSNRIFLQPTPPKTFADPVVDFRARIFLFLLKRKVREVAFVFYGSLIALASIGLFSENIAFTAATASANLRGSNLGFVESAAEKMYAFSNKSIRAEVVESYRPKAIQMDQNSFYPMAFESRESFFLFARSLVVHARYAIQEPARLSYMSSGKITTVADMNQRIARWQSATDSFLKTGYFPPFQNDEIDFLLLVAKNNFNNVMKQEAIKYSIADSVLEKSTMEMTKSFIANLSQAEGNVAKALKATKGE